jgi:hypothetical protein
MSWQSLIVGGIEIPRHALSDEFSQDYEELAGIAGLRLSDGGLVIQRAWPATGYKLRTTISGGGSLPAPLDSLDRGAAHEISCAEPRRIAAAGNVITLPAGRRTDSGHTPDGYALVDGLLVPTALSLVGHVATLTVVSGAQHYHARYWPKFSGLLVHKSGGSPWQAARRWSITLEEV